MTPTTHQGPGVTPDTRAHARAVRALCALGLAIVASGLFAPSAARHLALAAEGAAPVFAPGGPMETTRTILEQTHGIVLGEGDRNTKLVRLKDLLRGFLDTDALGRKAMGKHLDGRSPAEVADYLSLFRELFVRTYVQRLLLFDAPDFDYVSEKIDGDRADIDTAIVTPRDRFGVRYEMKRSAGGWRATDILVEDVSLANNFRSQFDAALAKQSFSELLDRLRKKVGEKPDPSAL